MDLIYEKSRPGRRAGRVPSYGLPVPEIPAALRRGSPPRLPEVPENEIVRHFTELADRNFGIDTGFYPLGSCTMKHNPRVNERVVGLPGFRDLHPLQEEDGIQGALVDARVVLHRAAAERVEAGIDPEVPVGQLGEVADDLVLGDLGESRRALPAELGGDLGHGQAV